MKNLTVCEGPAFAKNWPRQRSHASWQIFMLVSKADFRSSATCSVRVNFIALRVPAPTRKSVSCCSPEVLIFVLTLRGGRESVSEALWSSNDRTSSQTLLLSALALALRLLTYGLLAKLLEPAIFCWSRGLTRDVSRSKSLADSQAARLTFDSAPFLSSKARTLCGVAFLSGPWPSSAFASRQVAWSWCDWLESRTPVLFSAPWVSSTQPWATESGPRDFKFWLTVCHWSTVWTSVTPAVFAFVLRQFCSIRVLLASALFCPVSRSPLTERSFHSADSRALPTGFRCHSTTLRLVVTWT